MIGCLRHVICLLGCAVVVLVVAAALDVNDDWTEGDQVVVVGGGGGSGGGGGGWGSWVILDLSIVHQRHAPPELSLASHGQGCGPCR